MSEMLKDEWIIRCYKAEKEARNNRDELKMARERINVLEMENRHLKNQQFIHERAANPELEHTRNAVQLVMMNFQKAKGA